jgi:hypothetical protein
MKFELTSFISHSSPTAMSSFLTLLTSLFLFASTVLAQGRTGTTRGQIFFGCYTARPTGAATQPAPTQAANSASFAGCLVRLLLSFFPITHAALIVGIKGSSLTFRPNVVPCPLPNSSDTGKHQPKTAGVVPYFNSPDLNKLPMLPAQLLNGHMVGYRLHLRHMGHHLVGPLQMLDLLRLRIRR